MPEFIVTEEEAGLPIEQLLHQRVPAAPESYLRQLLKKGKVKISDDPVKGGDCVALNDRILLPDSNRLLELLANRQIAQPQLDILYETREILIVNKPARLAIHNGKGHERDNLTDQIGIFLAARGDLFRFAPIHRLDLETSGPVIFGKGKKSCSELGKLFMRGEITKSYLALVTGKIIGRGTLLSDIPAKGKLKAAESSYHTLVGNDSVSLLEIQLHTGRQHQIRRQLADAGHPLFGDQRYRGPCPRKLSRLFLHGRRLAFVEPFSKQQIDINCPLPADLTRFLPQVGIEQ